MIIPSLELAATGGGGTPATSLRSPQRQGQSALVLRRRRTTNANGADLAAKRSPQQADDSAEADAMAKREQQHRIAGRRTGSLTATGAHPQQKLVPGSTTSGSPSPHLAPAKMTVPTSSTQAMRGQQARPTQILLCNTQSGSVGQFVTAASLCGKVKQVDQLGQSSATRSGLGELGSIYGLPTSSLLIDSANRWFSSLPLTETADYHQAKLANQSNEETQSSLDRVSKEACQHQLVGNIYTNPAYDSGNSYSTSCSQPTYLSQQQTGSVAINGYQTGALYTTAARSANNQGPQTQQGSAIFLVRHPADLQQQQQQLRVQPTSAGQQHYPLTPTGGQPQRQQQQHQQQQPGQPMISLMRADLAGGTDDTAAEDEAASLVSNLMMPSVVDDDKSSTDELNSIITGNSQHHLHQHIHHQQQLHHQHHQHHHLQQQQQHSLSELLAQTDLPFKHQLHLGGSMGDQEPCSPNSSIYFVQNAAPSSTSGSLQNQSSSSSSSGCNKLDHGLLGTDEANNTHQTPFVASASGGQQQQAGRLEPADYNHHNHLLHPQQPHQHHHHQLSTDTANCHMSGPNSDYNQAPASIPNSSNGYHSLQNSAASGNHYYMSTSMPEDHQQNHAQMNLDNNRYVPTVFLYHNQQQQQPIKQSDKCQQQNNGDNNSSSDSVESPSSSSNNLDTGQQVVEQQQQQQQSQRKLLDEADIDGTNNANSNHNDEAQADDSDLTDTHSDFLSMLPSISYLDHSYSPTMLSSSNNLSNGTTNLMMGTSMANAAQRSV